MASPSSNYQKRALSASKSSEPPESLDEPPSPAAQRPKRRRRNRAMLLPELRWETLAFFARAELEQYQLELNSKSQRKEIEAIMLKYALLRHIHSVTTEERTPDGTWVSKVNICFAPHDGGPVTNKYSRELASLSEDDVEDLLRRLSNTYIDDFGVSNVLASSTTNSLERLMAQRKVHCRIGTADYVVPNEHDDFDYAFVDFFGAVVKPNLTRFGICHGHAGDVKAFDLLERPTFRGRSFEIDLEPDIMPPPERLLASTLLARTCNFRPMSFPNHWVDAFINCFVNATSLGTHLEDLTLEWDDGETLPAERLKTPTKNDVPIPRHDFVVAHTPGDRAIVRSKCALHQFVNRMLKKRLDVYSWATHSDFTTHALLFKIVDV